MIIYTDKKAIVKFLDQFDAKPPFNIINDYNRIKDKGINDDDLIRHFTENIGIILNDNHFVIMHKINDFQIIKLRIPKYKSNQGKSSGYRIIGLLDKNQDIFVLLNVYMHQYGKDNLSHQEKNDCIKFLNEYYNRNEE